VSPSALNIVQSRALTTRHKSVSHKIPPMLICGKIAAYTPVSGGISRHQPWRSREGYLDGYLYNQELCRKGIDQMTDVETNTLPVWFVVIAWAALSLILNVLGVFTAYPDQPPFALLVAIIGPPILFLIAYAFSANVRTLSLRLDLRLLTAMQGWRVIGALFLVLMSFGLLAGTFAWPAGIGDLIVGGYAPFVVLAISRRTPGWHTHVVLLNVLGLLDFVGAVGGGVLSGSSSIGILRGDVTTDILLELPLSMIPTFAVPFWIVLHIISLIKLRNAQAAVEEAAA
jgi:hypothetical protein